MTTRRDDSEAGFTLVELLVALFIFALIASASMAFLFQTLGASKTLSARIEELEALEVTRALLKADLLQLADRPTRGRYGEAPAPGFMGGVTASTSAFLTLVRRGAANPGAYAARSSLQHVSYRVEAGQLIREVRARLDPAADTATDRQILLRDIQLVSVRFWVEGHWQNRVDGTDIGAGPPAAISLTLHHKRLGEIEQLFLTGAKERS